MAVLGCPVRRSASWGLRQLEKTVVLSTFIKMFLYLTMDIELVCRFKITRVGAAWNENDKIVQPRLCLFFLGSPEYCIDNIAVV
jgi:hypothetical protein